MLSYGRGRPGCCPMGEGGLDVVLWEREAWMLSYGRGRPGCCPMGEEGLDVVLWETGSPVLFRK